MNRIFNRLQRDRHEPNRWKDFIIGVLGSIAGLIAMRLYWQYVAPQIAGKEPSKQPRDNEESEPQPLDDISFIGRQYRAGESSTAAIGRLAYREIAGKEPRAYETKTILSNLVHWIYGLLQGGLYGVMSNFLKIPDPVAGLMYGAGLWFFGDELAVPMLGLQGGPTDVSADQHLNRLGAHLAYGLATAVTTHVLHRIF
jgi:hypothetical protein